MKKHFELEIAKLKGFLSKRIEAHPRFFPKPFEGNHVMSYLLQPPRPRAKAEDKLWVEMGFAVRTGVTVHVAANADGAGVTVTVTMSDVHYTSPELTKKTEVNYTRSKLQALNPSAAEALEVAIFGSLLLPGDPLASAFEAEGILSDVYERLPAVVNKMTTVAISALPAVTPVVLDDKQPFPVIGAVILSWGQAAAVHTHGTVEVHEVVHPAPAHP